MGSQEVVEDPDEWAQTPRFCLALPVATWGAETVSVSQFAICPSSGEQGFGVK